MDIVPSYQKIYRVIPAQSYLHMVKETKKIPLIHNFAQFFEDARMNMFPALKKLSQAELHLNYELPNDQE